MNLGPLEPALRNALLNEDPGEPHQFGFALAKVEWTIPMEGGVMSAPTPVRYHGVRAYWFIAFGFFWMFIASRDARELAGRFPFVGAEELLTIPRGHQLDPRKLFATMVRAVKANEARRARKRRGAAQHD